MLYPALASTVRSDRIGGIFLDHAALITAVSVTVIMFSAGPRHSHLTTLRDHYILSWLFRCSPHILDLLHRVHAVDDFAKDDMFAVEPWCWHCRNEELASVRVWS